MVAEGLIWAGTGLLAWSRRPSNRMGLLLVLTGCAFLLGALPNTGVPVIAAAGTLFVSLALGFAIHVLLAFPSGRVQGRAARYTVAYAYVFAVLVPLPAALLTPGSPIAVGDVPWVTRVGEVVESAGGLAAFAVAALLLLRLRSLSAAQRRQIGVLLVYGAVAIVAVTFAAQLQRFFGLDPVLKFVLQLAALAVIPVTFTIALLRGGFARAGAVEELGTMLAEDTAPTQDVLARVLGDPTVELLHWLPSEQTWVDSDGRPRSPERAQGRGLVEVSIAGERAGALTYDVGLLPDPDLVTAAARPAALALQAERLQVELRRSRSRLVAAADAERTRLARDLHDGLQVRLLLMGMRTGTLAATSTDPAVRQEAEELRRELDAAAGELRRTVEHLLPAVLVERGLAAAVADLVDRMPIPTTLSLEDVDGGLPAYVAETAWYVVSEGLTNALKHAAGDSAQRGRAGGRRRAGGRGRRRRPGRGEPRRRRAARAARPGRRPVGPPDGGVDRGRGHAARGGAAPGPCGPRGAADHHDLGRHCPGDPDAHRHPDHTLMRPA